MKNARYKLLALAILLALSITGCQVAVTVPMTSSSPAKTDATQYPFKTDVLYTITTSTTVRSTVLPTTTETTLTLTTEPVATSTTTSVTTTTVSTAASTYAPTATAKPTGGVIFYGQFADPRSMATQPAIGLGTTLALVNKTYALEKDYVPLLAAIETSGKQAHPIAVSAYVRLKKAILDETGVRIDVTAGYRSYATQESVFNRSIQRYGIEHAVKRAALAGRSEHQLGLAFDLCDATTQETLVTVFEKTPAYKEVLKRAADFGFIQRYQAGKEHITGYANEPWHWRYVGPEAAGEITRRGLALEEYLGVA